MAKATASLTYDDNKEATIKLQNKSLIKEFSILGRLNTLHAKINNPENIDIIDLMDILRPTANNLLKLIKEQMNYLTNEATLPKPINKTEQKRRSNAVRIFKQYSAIKKIAQRSYIVSPYLIVPRPDLQETIVNRWNSLP